MNTAPTPRFVDSFLMDAALGSPSLGAAAHLTTPPQETDDDSAMATGLDSANLHHESPRSIQAGDEEYTLHASPVHASSVRDYTTQSRQSSSHQHFEPNPILLSNYQQMLLKQQQSAEQSYRDHQQRTGLAINTSGLSTTKGPITPQPSGQTSPVLRQFIRPGDTSAGESTRLQSLLLQQQQQQQQQQREQQQREQEASPIYTSMYHHQQQDVASAYPDSIISDTLESLGADQRSHLEPPMSPMSNAFQQSGASSADVPDGLFSMDHEGNQQHSRPDSEYDSMGFFGSSAAHGANGYGVSMSQPRSLGLGVAEQNPEKAEFEYADPEGSVGGSAKGNPGQAGPQPQQKTHVAYAQLIYRALMSTPNHCMMLQDIYKWFTENTDKALIGGRGWQNSIRHNLSMNQAFTKIDPNKTKDKGSKAAIDEDSSIVKKEKSDDSFNATTDKEERKSTMWWLMPFAIEKGPISTTRYRTKKAPKNSSSSKYASSAGGIRKAATPAVASSASSRLGGMAASTLDPLARSNRMRSRMQTRYQAHNPPMHPDLYAQAYQPYSQHQPSYTPAVYAPDFSAAWDPQLFDTVTPRTTPDDTSMMTGSAPTNSMRYDSVGGIGASPASTMMAYQTAPSASSGAGGASSYDYSISGMGMMPSW